MSTTIKLNKQSLIAVIGLIALFGTTAVLIGLAIGGGADELQILDAGAVVRFGLPIAKMIANFASAIAIGALVLAAFALPENSATLQRAQSIGAVASVAWVISGISVLQFTYLALTGSAFSTDESFGQGLWLFITQIQLGQYLALNILGGALFALLAVSFRSLSSTALIAALGFASLVPLALTGHAAGTANHSMAVNSIGVHLVAVVIWVGGLVTIALLAPGPERDHAVRRYSSLALLSFVLVAVSGVISASIRFSSISDWLSPYGVMALFKAAVLIALGVLGAIYRRGLIARGKASGAGFWRLVLVEVALMATAIGMASALSRTAPPLDETATVGTTPAELLTGEKLPSEFNAVTLFTAVKPDLVWAIIGVGAAAAYIAGVRRLRARGDSWPIARTVSWLAGCLLLIFITNGSMNAYQEYLFSVHMIAHMLLTMAVPVLLVPGAPITLLSRAVEKRTDGSRGIREWALWAVHTKYAAFISHPIVAAINFASSLVVFYFTPIFGWATREHIGHQWMIIHFLITGYLFVQALIGVDPGPTRMSFPIRLMLLIATLAFHAFFGLALMSGTGLLLPDWYGAMGRTWGESPLDDQHTGGAIAWGIGELPAAVLTIIVSVQWARADGRDAKRLDRASDRGGNKDIDEYNELLAQLAARPEKKR